MKLRSPEVPSWVSAAAMPSYSVVSPFDFRPAIAARTTARFSVGAVTTLGAEEKVTTPTYTSAGADARKASAARTTVAMPDAPMEPLVSISNVVTRRTKAIGLTDTAASTPPSVAFTDAGSIVAPLAVRAVRMAVMPVAVTWTSLRDTPPGSGAADAAEP